MVIADAVPHAEKERRASSLKIEKLAALSTIPQYITGNQFCFHRFRWKQRNARPYARLILKNLLRPDEG